MFRARLPSAHLTKCHACHGICTLSPLDTALTMRFAKNTQHDTSEVLRLPRKITMDTSEVLRLPRTLQRILQKRRKIIAPATQIDFRHQACLQKWTPPEWNGNTCYAFGKNKTNLHPFYGVMIDAFLIFLSELGFRIQHFHTLSLCLECIAEDSFHSVIVVWETRFCFTLFCALYHYLSLILVFS